MGLTKSFGKVLKNRISENRSSENHIMQGPGVYMILYPYHSLQMEDWDVTLLLEV